ncbi:MAG: endolytic transglycosylase MltG [Candidatus Sungbacteria bacterium]|nr:endolytic transglycosylase MltG [Candidatus Sungbacteria bacterium]MBI4099304.1 endolytic transglycosylase MltG [Candidatus Parcubacteria bacterium]MBI4385432.1 endolytic transglycosylase MltG [Candidatus Parcubacteria bacterium]
MVKRVVIWASAAALLMALLVWGADVIILRAAQNPWRSGAPTRIINIPRGYGLDEIARLLAREGVVRSSFVFQYSVWRRGWHERLQAGEYELSAAMSSREIAERMMRGLVREQGILVTIPEGTRLTALIEMFSAAGLPQTREFGRAASAEWQEDFAFLPGRSDRSLEGYLFPDTYRFLPDAAAGDIAATLLGTFEERVLTRDLQERIRASGRTLDEVVIMASLLEREVRSNEDQQVVAGILWKRLDAGIPLQVDATVAYSTGKKSTAITAEELARESPYNTYLHAGLPFGPINSPGVRSINNALNSRATDYWFYLSKPDGETVFSKTSQEHAEAVQKFLRP